MTKLFAIAALTCMLIGWLVVRVKRRYHTHPIPYHHDLDTPLLQFGRRDLFTIRHACEGGGVLIIGGSGSGKTSSMQGPDGIIRALVASGAGGIILCIKPGDAAKTKKLMGDCGRAKQVIMFDKSARHRLNFLDYLQATVGKDGFDQSLVQAMSTVMEAARAQSGGGGSGDNQFFRDAAMQLLANALPMLRIAYGSLRLKELYRFIVSAPKSPEEAYNATWQANSFCSQTLMRVAQQAEAGDCEAERILEEHGDYWIEEFPSLGDRTRGSIVTTLTSTIYPFLSGKLAELFCTDTTITPDHCRQGLVIIVDLPTQVFGHSAAVALQIWKLLFQICAEREIITKKTRPIFCICDEAQFTMNSRDAEHLAVAREARAISIFMTQDLPTFTSRIGGAGGKDAANSVLEKFQTRIFMSNLDVANTGRYASDIIGKVTKYHSSESISRGENSGGGATAGEQEGGFSSGYGSNQGRTNGATAYEGDAVAPDYFARELRTGGPANQFRVDAIVIRNGYKFKASKKHWLQVEFRQK